MQMATAILRATAVMAPVAAIAGILVNVIEPPLGISFAGLLLIPLGCAALGIYFDPESRPQQH